MPYTNNSNNTCVIIINHHLLRYAKLFYSEISLYSIAYTV